MSMSAEHVTVIGATGTVGVALVDVLARGGHRVTCASRSTGIDVTTGVGLTDALRGAQVLIDVTNAPARHADAAEAFFTRAAINLTDAAHICAVTHYIALSIVGVHDIAHLKGKLLQERTIQSSGIDYTIIRAAQFHEFAEQIVAAMSEGGVARVPDAHIQPMAVADVAAVLAGVAGQPPRNATLDVGGPEVMTFAALANAVIDHRQRTTTVTIDPEATYFGTPIHRDSLIPEHTAHRTSTRFADWITAH
jgi:uncharacterized protein YbjT (DUF2867 family)